MVPIEETKVGLLIPPQLKDDGAPSGLTYIDTAGYRHLRVLLLVGTTDIAFTAAPIVQFCDTTDGTYSSVTAAALGDAPSATEDDGIFCIDVALDGKQGRYAKLLCTAGNGTTGTNLAALAILSKAEQAPDTTTKAGLTEWIKAQAVWP